MNPSTTDATLVLDIVVPAAIALLLHYFYFRLEKSYLRAWSLFWTGVALFKILALLGSDLVVHPPAIVGALISASAAAALFFGIVQLLSGSFTAVHLRPLKLKPRRTLNIAAIASVLLVAGFLYRASSSPDQQAFHFSSITGLTLGIAYLASAGILWRPGRRGTSALLLLKVVFVVAGAARIAATLARDDSAFLIGTPYVVFELVLNGAIGIGMVIRLLDEERTAALSAADQVAHMVYHEELTGLANRSLLLDRLMMSLTQAERRSKLLALVFLDIDGFKPVNDTLGHDVGDLLLKSVADRIRSVVRAEDTVARFGGDEFVILIPELRAPEDTGRIGTKLTDAIRQPFNAGEHEISVTTSVGIAVYPDDGRDADTLMRNADKAMYQAKEKGGDQFQLYSVSMNHRALERLELEMNLRRGLEFRQMELHFQPIVSGSTSRLIGFEALLHWDHPTRGLLTAEKFLPAAERSGMLAPICKFTISEACRQLAGWQKKVDANCFVAINVSAAELKEEDVFSHLALSLQEYQLDPTRIEMEITETSASPDLDIQSVVLPRLRELGIRITIDDFGNRFASLAQLRNSGFDAVKLSPVLTTDIDDSTNAVITSGVIGIAHGLKLEVGSEGIADDHQLMVLRQQGCDRFQGPLFGEPLPAEKVAEFIRTFDTRA